MLELQHVSYRVEGTEGDREILHDVSLTINERFVAITGPNGGGKSTLAKLIAGIYTPIEGRILLDGTDIRRCRSPTAPGWEYPTPFSSPSVLRD